jgi:hypothetical protein
MRSLRKEGGEDLLDIFALALGTGRPLAAMVSQRLHPVEYFVTVATAILIGGHSILLVKLKNSTG